MPRASGRTEWVQGAGGLFSVPGRPSWEDASVCPGLQVSGPEPGDATRGTASPGMRLVLTAWPGRPQGALSRAEAASVTTGSRRPRDRKHLFQRP